MIERVTGLVTPRESECARTTSSISGAGRWGVRYSAFGQPSFCAVLEGSCRLTVDGHRPLTLEAGDFVLLPATPGFAMLGFEPVRLQRFDPNARQRCWVKSAMATRGARPDVRLLGGWFVFDSPDTALLISLLPSLVRGVERLSILVRLVGEEASERRAGRDLVLTRLVEVLLMKRSGRRQVRDAPPGLLRGWPMHDSRPRYARCTVNSHVRWTVALLARTRGLRVGEYVQHRVQPARGPVSGPLRA
jgi:hypothetical protein